MGKVGFRIRSKTGGHVPVYVNVYLCAGNQLEAKTGFVTNLTKWDTTFQRSNDNSLYGLELNEKLDKLEYFILSALNELSSNLKTLNREWLIDLINSCFNRSVQKPSNRLLNHIDGYINASSTRRNAHSGSIGLSYNSMSNLMRFYELIDEYEREEKIILYLSELDYNKIEHFQRWLLQNRRYSVNYCGLILRLFKTVCKDAQKKGLKVHDYVQQITVFRQRKKDRIMNILSLEEVEKIRRLEGLPDNLLNSQRWLLIGINIGQRVSDLLTLSPDNIRPAEGGLYIDLIQKKTDRLVTIGVGQDYVIDILKSHFPYPVSNMLFNMHIKTLCKMAGISQMVKGFKMCCKTRRKKVGIYPKYSLMASHDLRRSFATNYFGEIPTPVLMKITGHSKESTFLHYIGISKARILMPIFS